MTVGTQTTPNEGQTSYLAGKGGFDQWFSTTDHKRIGLMFLGWTMFAFLLGGLCGLVPVARSLFGQSMDPRTLFQVNTYHRLLLAFLFVVPAVPSILGHFVLPIQLGARNLALPGLARLSLRSYVVGLVLIVASLVISPIATTWTLSWAIFEPGAFGLVALGLFCVAASWFLTGVNFLVTVHHERAEGMGFFEMPVMAWSMYLSGYLLVAVGALFGIVVLYQGAAWCSGEGIFAEMPGLWTRYFWFLTTPVVFFSFVPAVGVIFEVVAGISRRAVRGYRMVVGSLIALLGLSLFAGGVFLSGLGQAPNSTLVFSALSLLAVIPVALLTYSLLSTLYNGANASEGPDVFVIGFLLNGGMACLMGLILASPALGSYLGSTMFATTMLDYVIWGSTLFALMAGLHYWWPKMIGLEYNQGVAKLGAVLMMAGLNLALIPRLIMGTLGVGPDMYSLFQGPSNLAMISGLGWLLVYGGLITVISNLVSSMWKGSPYSVNPWGASTLEWKTSTPPPVGNFDGTPVFEGLYKYK